jgi:Skp family chaperone for outer membrane proteins
MKKIFALILILNFLNINNSFATKIGIIDVDKIIAESTAVIEIQKKVDAKKTSFESEINKKQSQLEADQKKLEDKKATLSQSAFEKEVKNFEAKVEELKTNIDRKQNSLKKGSIEAMSKVQDKLKMIINDLAKEKSLDLIIPASQTLFAKDEFDITAEVLVILNKKISKVDVKFE